MSAIFVGVDPGLKGGLAALHSDGRVEVVPMPVYFIRRKNHPTKSTVDGQWVKDWLRALGTKSITLMVIEKAIVLPRQGLVSGSRFVGDQRYITGIAHGLDITCIEVLPGQWKRALKLGKGDLHDKKAASIAMCRKLYPYADIRRYSKVPGKRLSGDSHDLAEAVLLAHYARESASGRL